MVSGQVIVSFCVYNNLSSKLYYTTPRIVAMKDSSHKTVGRTSHDHVPAHCRQYTPGILSTVMSLQIDGLSRGSK